MAKLQVALLVAACVLGACMPLASAAEAKMYYGDHEGPFDYSLLEADSRSDLPAQSPRAPVVVGREAAFPFEVPRLPADFPNDKSNFEPISSHEYAINQALLEERATTHMHPGFLGYAPQEQFAMAHTPGMLHYDEGFALHPHSHYMVPVRAEAYAVPSRDHHIAMYQHDGRESPVPVFLESHEMAKIVQKAHAEAKAAETAELEAKKKVEQDYTLDDVGPPSSFPADKTERITDPADDNATATNAKDTSKLALNGDAPVNAPRFAQAKNKESQVTPIEPAGSSGPVTGSSPVSSSSMDAPAGSMAGSSSMDAAAGDPLGASTTSLPDEGAPAKRYRCITRDGQSCAVRFPGDIQWKVNVVDKLDEPKSASGDSSVTPQSSSLAEAGIVAPYSDNPEIAAAQKAYYQREQDLIKEKNWVVQIQKVIREYQDKVRNVQAHVNSEKHALKRTKDSIIRMIRKDKQQKLTAELRLAIDALKKLESTSQDLNSKISDLKGTKQKLHQTISRIQRSLGGALTSTMRETAGSLLEVGGETAPEALEVLNEAKSLSMEKEEKANDQVKSLFGSLLELAESHENQVDAAHHHHHHQHELSPYHHDHAHSKALDAILARARDEKEADHDDSPSLIEENEDEEDRETRHAIRQHKADVSLLEKGSLTDRVDEISKRYAAEETGRLNADIPLSDLALKEADEIDHDETLQG